MPTSAGENGDELVEQLLDAILYAPIGLIARGVESIPDLAQRGRANAANAKVIGTFALGATNAKARSAIADAESHLAAFLEIVARSASPKRSGTPAKHDTSTPSSPSSSTDSGIDDLIAGYDSLTAAQILPLLAELEPEGRARVESHERSKRARKTILNRLRQLQG